MPRVFGKRLGTWLAIGSKSGNVCQIEIELNLDLVQGIRPHCNRRNVEFSCDNSQESSLLRAAVNILEKSRFGEKC